MLRGFDDPPPKYIIINLGMSKNFGAIDFEHLTFPTHMRVDYIRVYQDIRHINIGCDPEGYPTLDYINKSVKPQYYKFLILIFSLVYIGISKLTLIQI